MKVGWINSEDIQTEILLKCGDSMASLWPNCGHLVQKCITIQFLCIYHLEILELKNQIFVLEKKQKHDTRDNFPRASILVAIVIWT